MASGTSQDRRWKMPAVLTLAASLAGGLAFGAYRYWVLESGGLVCLRPEYDFGKMPQAAASREIVFDLKNTSARPIKITNVTSSCGCTVAKIARQIVQPGEQLHVNVHVNWGYSWGSQSTAVLVSTDCEKTPKIMLQVHGEIDAPARASPQFVHFGEVAPGKTETRIVDLYGAEGRELKVQRIECSSNAVTVSLQHDESVLNTEQFRPEHSYAIALKGSELPDSTSFRVDFYTDDPKAPTISVFADFRTRRGPTSVQ